MRPKLTSDEDLLAIARACVLEAGPGVSTSHIAERAGVSQATLFKRFGNKRTLLERALGVGTVRDWIPRLERGPEARPLDDQLLELATDITGFYSEHLPLFLSWRASKSAQMDALRQEFVQAGEVPPPQRALRALAHWFDAAQANGDLGSFDPNAMAIAFLSGCQGPAIRSYMTREEIDLESYVPAFVHGFWSGVKP